MLDDEQIPVDSTGQSNVIQIRVNEQIGSLRAVVLPFRLQRLQVTTIIVLMLLKLLLLISLVIELVLVLLLLLIKFVDRFVNCCCCCCSCC